MLRATFQTQGVARENVADDHDGSPSRAEQRLGLLKDARFLLTLRDELAAEEDRLAASRMKLARQYLDDGTPPTNDEEETP
jgi:hypothetical protein